MLVVALSLTAVATSTVAREYRTADPRQSEVMSGMIGGLGADPFELPYGQVLTGLATKPIDGAQNDRPSFVTTDHDGHAGRYTLAEPTMSPEVPVMPTQQTERIRKVE